MKKIFAKASRILRQDGLAALKVAIRRQIENHKINKEYSRWIDTHDRPSKATVDKLQARLNKMDPRPRIAIVIPVYNVAERFLREALDSVLDQDYPDWELCIADDNSPSPHVHEVLTEYSEKDSRIKVIFRETNGHISESSNSAINLVSAPFVALMDHDDVLAKDALLHVAEVIYYHPETTFIYSDEDKITEDGARYHPTFKPDWSPELLTSLNMVTHLCVFRTDLLREIGGFRVGFEGSQDYDLALRYLAKVSPSTIYHIPHILYHWRSIPGSVALDVSEKSYAHENARHALSDYFRQARIPARSCRGVGQIHRTIYTIPSSHTSVAVIVCGTWPEVSSGTKRYLMNTASGLTDTSIHYIPDYFQSSNTSKSLFRTLNQMVRSITSDVIIFIPPTTLSLSEGFIHELTSRAMLPDIGAVGGKIVGKDARVLHGGYIFNPNGTIQIHNQGRHTSDYGYFMRNVVDQNLSAVSIDCLAIRRENLIDQEGFDDKTFPSKYADTDLCQRLICNGKRILWTPWAVLTISNINLNIQCNKNELLALTARWSNTFAHDPYYNPNLAFHDSNSKTTFSWPPRIVR